MVVCLLARHATHGLLGRTLVGRGDVALDATGHREAKRIAADLALRGGITRIQSSPQRRASETARPIAEELGLAIETMAALDELDYGAWTGVPFEALTEDPDWAAWNNARSNARPPGGESAGDLEARVVAHLVATAGGSNCDDCIVMVSHAEPIRVAVLHARGLGLDRWAEVDIAPAAIAALDVNEGRITLAAEAGPWRRGQAVRQNPQALFAS